MYNVGKKDERIDTMKIKYLVVGFIIGVLATISITAGASTVYEKFTAIARPDYQLVVDGQKVTLNNPPKTIDGVTHLPVREVANILDKNVNFNGTNGTITLTSKLESERDSVSDKIYVNGRQLIELLGVKHPELDPIQITLNPKGLLKIGEDTYNLEVNDEKQYEVSVLIDAGVLSENDFQ